MFGRFVEMKFAPDMADAVINGIETEDGYRIYKVWSVRTKPCGRPGDFFTVRRQAYQITRIFREKLGEAAECYELQGFRSKEEFIARWNKLHPRKKYDPEETVWVHEFVPEPKMIVEFFGRPEDGDQI